MIPNFDLSNLDLYETSKRLANKTPTYKANQINQVHKFSPETSQTSKFEMKKTQQSIEIKEKGNSNFQ